MKVDARVSAEAEVAIRRLGRELHDARDPESLVLSAVATIEAHVDAVIQQLLDDASAKQSRLGIFLLAKAEGTFKLSWQARNDLLRGGFGVVVEPQLLAQNLQLVIDVRNALAHGDGSLTEQQIANWSKAIVLRRNLERRLSIPVSGRKISLTLDSAKKAVVVLIDFIGALDAAIQQARRDGAIGSVGVAEAAGPFA